MKNSIWQQKIPTILGVIMLVVGIVATSLLTRNVAIFQGRASNSQDPKDVRITNITDKSFTVSYTTSASVVGSIIFGKDKPATTVLDDRDQTSVASHTIHFFTIKNLTPSTQYLFSIVSGSSTYSQGSQPFQVTTGPTISSSLSSKTVTGKLAQPDGNAPKEALVYIRSNITQSLSALTSSDGSFSFSIADIRTQNLEGRPDLSNRQLLMLATDGVASSNVTFSADQSIIPLITLSKDYDFTVSESPLATPPAALSFPTVPATQSGTINPDIVSPQNGQELTDQKPLFKGTAPPNTTVSITIHSDAQTIEVTTDNSGNWSYRPTQPLDPGQHTIAVTARNQSGILQTISRSFTVFASGSQVEQSATPSATPTFSPSPTVAFTPTPTIVPAPISGDQTPLRIGFIALIMALLGGGIVLLSRGRISL